MSTHSRVLVAPEAWSFSSPEVRSLGNSIDLGLIAEALIYYDSVLINFASQPHLRAFIEWFARDDAFAALVELLESDTVKLVDFSFVTLAGQVGTDYELLNLQDELQAQPNTFARRYLYHSDIEAALPKKRHRVRLMEACAGRTIEFKASEFDRGVQNAKQDALDPSRSALVVQALVDEAYRIARRPSVPTVRADVSTDATSGKHRITWNVNLTEVRRAARSR